MSKVIHVLVPAENEKSAVGSATRVLDAMCGEGQDYEYYTLLGDHNGPDPQAYHYDTQRGRERIDAAIAEERDHFLRHIMELRKILSEHGDREIFENRGSGRWSTVVRGLSDRDSAVFDDCGGSLHTDTDVRDAITNYHSEHRHHTRKQSISVWVVSADMHW